MDQAFDTFDVYERAVVNNTSDNTLNGVTNLELLEALAETFFDRFFFRKDQFVVLDVTYRLNKIPRYNTSYGAVEKELEQMKVRGLSIAAISQAIINIRTSKLPDPAVIGNAGSFFKNPSVSKERFEDLKAQFQSMIGYENFDGTIKLAAGWLIEQCGWKGFRKGDAGCYEKQALVLVNYGKATGGEIYDLSEEILRSVRNKFGVDLEREVNII